LSPDELVTLRELETVDYDEPRADGETHHHRSWVFIGQSVSASIG